MDITLANLNSHPYALWYIGELFRRQAQPIRIESCTKTGFIINMKVNLTKVQLDRLFVREINEKMVGYTAKADHAKKQLKVYLSASEGKQAKPAGNKGKAAA